MGSTNFYREASTVWSLDEFRLSKKSLRVIEKKEMSIQELILLGRREYEFRGRNYANIREKWLQEFVASMDRIGLIRHDIDHGTSAAWNLYEAILDYRGNGRKDRILNFGDSSTNEEYEKFCNLSDSCFTAFVKCLRSNLNGKEFAFIVTRFNFDDSGNEVLKNYTDIGRELGISVSTINSLKRSSFRKLSRNMICSMLRPDGTGVIEERKNRDLDVPPDRIGLCDIRISSSTRSSLRRKGIYTVGDILKYPKYQWVFFGKRTKMELLAVLDQLGYTNFTFS